MSDPAPRTESVVARAGQAMAGAAFVVIGIASLPLPLFPSLIVALLGVALIARSSLRIRRWLFAQAWFTRALARVTNERAQRLLARLLGSA